MAHRIGSLVTVGGDTLADRAALQGNEPWVDAAAGGVDSDGVAAGAGHPELVAGIVSALVGHPGHGADPRFNAEPPSNAASKLWRPANGPRRRRLSPYRSMAPRGAKRPVVTRGAATNAGYFCGPVPCGVCPLQVQGMSRGPAPPTWGVARPGDDGSGGDRPPSDAAPRGP